jgi:hypothetical protein
VRVYWRPVVAGFTAQFIARPVKEVALGHFAPRAPFTMNVGVLVG